MKNTSHKNFPLRILLKAGCIYAFYLVIIIFINSCCRSSEVINYDLTSINVSNLIHADNQYTHTVETDTVLIEPPPELFGFQITFDYLILANLGGILPTAYALTCEADSYSIQVKISSIRIVSFYDFDVGHLSGFEATNLFKVDYESGNSIDKLINTDQMDAYFPFYRINFYLQSRPTLDQYQQFEVQFIMEGGQVLRGTTAVIHFL